LPVQAGGAYASGMARLATAEELSILSPQLTGTQAYCQAQSLRKEATNMDGPRLTEERLRHHLDTNQVMRERMCLALLPLLGPYSRENRDASLLGA
jgi:hypothetical protein